jgi:MinD-like ATPase involved in chromosome partitioning or flagellar assembly
VAKVYEALQKEKESAQPGISLPPSLVAWRGQDLSFTREVAGLYQEISFQTKDKGYRVFHFAGSREGEGVSSIVVSLARYMMAEKSVESALLIDTNLKQPVLHTAFGITHAPGLIDVLKNNARKDEAVHRITDGKIDLMPCGTLPLSESTSLEQKGFSDLISALRNEHQFILIDSGPLLASVDSLSAAVAADTTFLVIQAHSTQWEVALKAKSHLLEHGCQIAGAVINRIRRPIPSWIYSRL